MDSSLSVLHCLADAPPPGRTPCSASFPDSSACSVFALYTLVLANLRGLVEMMMRWSLEPVMMFMLARDLIMLDGETETSGVRAKSERWFAK